MGEDAFGGNPHLADPAHLTPQVADDDTPGRLETTFTRRIPGTHQLLYTLEVSDDLLAWDRFTASEVGSHPLSPVECLERVTFRTDAGRADEPRQFTRVRVDPAP